MKRFIAFFLMTIMVVSGAIPAKAVSADRIEEKPYLSLGADLKNAEKEVYFYE